MKEFHVTGTCNPEWHYMVNVSSRVEKITKDYIEKGKYFTINRARQYGKTTMMFLLRRYLEEKYFVVSISFEAADELFISPYILAVGLQRSIGRQLRMQKIPQEILKEWEMPISKDFAMDDLGERITDLCRDCDRKIVLMIDEVDKNSDNQVFLGFLGLLRSKYLARAGGIDTTFQSVILASVYDIKNLKLKIRSNKETKYNSPWNMHGKLIDERVAGSEDFPEKEDAWTLEGGLEAVRLFLKEPNTLFEDMVKKIQEYPSIKEMLCNILFRGIRYSFEIDNFNINIGIMFGFIKEKDNAVFIANRLYETKMYNLFLSEAEQDRLSNCNFVPVNNQFVIHGMLQMKLG